MSELHPVLPLAAATLLAPLVGDTGRRLLGLIAPAAAAVLLGILPDGAGQEIRLLGLELQVLRADSLARVFGLAFSLFAVMAGIYSWHDAKPGFRTAALGLTASAVGLTLSGDLLTAFLFWEGLTLSSLVVLWSAGTRSALDAGLRYFLMHAVGAACLVAGIALRVQGGHALAFGPIGLGEPSGALILVGFCMNAAVPPLHAWLPDAYPRTSPHGSVLLSAFTTKAAVFALARSYAGAEVLVWAGVAMALYGVVFAVLENDIRRLLAYHIISQVGYMVCGVGLGTALALDGVAAHAFSHIFYKGLLLMAAGAVVHATGFGRLTDLGGLGRCLPAVLVLYLVGAFSISGMPLFSGFTSKSMIVSASAGVPTVEWLLTIASMGTFLHTGLKLPWFTFFGPRPAPEVSARLPAGMTVAMVLAAAACLATGVAPGLLYGLLPHGGAYEPFTADHVVGALQLLLATALGFWILRGILGGEPTITRDVDGLYRKPLSWLAEATSGVLAAAEDLLGSVRPRLSEIRTASGAARQASAIVAAAAVLAGLALALSRDA